MSNNSFTYNRAVAAFLAKLNKIFALRGLLKFVSYNIYIQGPNIILLIRFRFLVNTRWRYKYARRYRYARRDLLKLNRKRRKKGPWVGRAIVNIVKLRARAFKLKKKLRFFDENIKYVALYTDRRRLWMLRERCDRALIKTMKRYEYLKRRIYWWPHFLAHKWTWSRNLRIWRHFGYGSKRRLVGPIARVYYNKKSTHIKLYRFKKKIYRRKFILRFSNRVYRILSNRIPRFMTYVPRGSFLHHRRVLRRIFVSRKRRIWRRKGYRLSIRQRRLRSRNRGRRKLRRSVVLKTRRNRMSRRSRRRLYFVKHIRARRSRKQENLRNQNRRRTFQRAGSRRFFKTRKHWRNFKRARSWRGRYKPRRFQNVRSWRKLVKKKDEIARAPLHRNFVLFFKLMPLLYEMKLFFYEYFRRTLNLRCFDVYLLNVNKGTGVNARLILEFVENFLRRRRRVTKINKLFYRLLKIIKFFYKKYRWAGFKLMLAGRFLRRDRATFIWRTKGAVPLSTKLAKIDFAARPMQMKYSRPILKLWICRR